MKIWCGLYLCALYSIKYGNQQFKSCPFSKRVVLLVIST